ncbi:EamA/RhaT family transporter, partial [Priestia megaterium]|nr:EamA/RhaT family transporter [Priestia megaterium]MCT9852752.1 EamA/RhaT family transporter [Priestia megaterium]
SALILREQMTIIQMLGGLLLLGSTFVSENKTIKFLKRGNKVSTL